MKNIISYTLIVGALFFCKVNAQSFSNASFGENEIRLYTTPLSYEVLSKGKTIIGKTQIDLSLDGMSISNAKALREATTKKLDGVLETKVYKKSSIDLSAQETLVEFERFNVRLVARKDGVAYRFEVKSAAQVDDESANVTLPINAECSFTRTKQIGIEESIPEFANASSLPNDEKMSYYLPFVFKTSDTVVAITESDVCDYPIWNFREVKKNNDRVVLNSFLEKYPKVAEGNRRIKVKERENYLAKFTTAHNLPWRVFILADSYAKLCEADIVYALARPAEEDFSWVNPGKVQWDWWSSFDHLGADKGCNTRNYERFIDLASKGSIEYVILDEGWGNSANIWEMKKEADIPHIIDVAKKRNVGIILWMAWAQVYGVEEKVAEHFAKMGVKGFKIDFMDRGDAQIETFLEKLAKACAKHKLVIVYHGAYRPTGLQRKYPNILNYEGVHGLEQMKDAPKDKDMTANDVAVFFLRLAAGPMDYTPGAMMNYKIGDYRGNRLIPGSVGTRVHQMAMMALYEAPLQMLSDGPANYYRNWESYSFMAKVPVVWDKTVGLSGTPSTYACAARQAKDGSWYVAAINNKEARTIEIDLSFLGEGDWMTEVFKDRYESDEEPEKYIHENGRLNKDKKFKVRLANGGGCIMHLRPVVKMDVKVNADKRLGKIKPMHAVNNMPTDPRDSYNLLRYYTEAKIPHARFHDTGGAYGGNRYVDIPNIFRNFDADENDPASYDFTFTDAIFTNLVEHGVKPYYRLGVTIENYCWMKSYRLDPPKDPAKWARICEHIVRHYNEGWANGYKMGIEYWEIWNEPDNHPEPKYNPMWSGTCEEFFNLYDVTAKHLKKCFPNIKVGGYASCGFYEIVHRNASSFGGTSTRTETFVKFFEDFLKYIKEHKSPIDFFSWHSYDSIVANRVYAKYAKDKLTEYGYGDIEIHFNEWNMGPNNRGKPIDAAKITAQMIDMQHLPVDMAMYYDGAMRSSYCGIFDPVGHKPFKAYSSFLYFGKLYTLGTEVETMLDSPDKGVFALAASDGKETALLLCNTTDKDVDVTTNLKTPITLYATDIDATREERQLFSSKVTLPPYAVWLLETK